MVWFGPAPTEILRLRHPRGGENVKNHSIGPFFYIQDWLGIFFVFHHDFELAIMHTSHVKLLGSQAGRVSLVSLSMPRIYCICQISRDFRGN